MDIRISQIVPATRDFLCVILNESFHIKSPNFSKFSMVTLSDFPEAL